MIEALKKAGLIRDEDIRRIEDERRRVREEASKPENRDRKLIVEGFGTQREGNA